MDLMVQARVRKIGNRYNIDVMYQHNSGLTTPENISELLQNAASYTKELLIEYSVAGKKTVFYDCSQKSVRTIDELNLKYDECGRIENQGIVIIGFRNLNACEAFISLLSLKSGTRDAKATYVTFGDEIPEEEIEKYNHP